MKITLLRHSNAADRPEDPKAGDAGRPLTAEGKSKAKRLGARLHELGVRFDLVLTSPALRALATAELVCDQLRPRLPLRAMPQLALPGDPGLALAALARTPRSVRRLLVVGHEPMLSQLASILLTGNVGMQIQLKRGGLIRLDVEKVKRGRCAVLDWCLAPRLYSDRISTNGKRH